MLQREAERRWTRLPEAQRAQRASRAAPATTAGPQPLDQVGRWGALTELDEYAIHASLLPTGKILIFGRQPERPDGTRENVGSALLFDPTGRGESEWVRPPPVEDTNGDGRVDDRDDPAAIYCAGQSLLADGRVFLAGGNLAEPGEGRPVYSGRVHTFLFDPWTKTWEVGPQMNRGRWYPSQVKLPTGEIAIVAGLDEDGQGTHNPEAEIYMPDEAGGAGRLEAMPAGDKELSLYPNLFLLPEGNVLLAGPRDNDSHLLDPTMRGPDRPQNSGWTAFRQQPSVKHMGGAAVLVPRAGAFGGVNEVLLMGGGDSDGGGYELARPTVEHLDAAARPEPAWSHGGADDFNQARFYPNVVLLPDDGMVAVGGGSGTDDRPGGYGNYHLEDPAPTELKRVELRRPGQEGWRLGAAQQEWRTYHSVALLLPDGRVLSAGDDLHEGPDPYQPVPDGVRRDSAEVYTPPYLFDGDRDAPRPQIEDAPARVGHGTMFGVRTPQAGDPARGVARAVLVAPAAVTHSVDMNQRVVPLRITETIPGEGVNVVAPPSTAVAPPGYYLLFLVDERGTPSTARWVQVLPGAQGGPPVTAPDPPADPEPPAEPEPGHSEPPPSPAPGLAPPTSAVVAPPASSRFPAKLKVRRARVDDGRLDLLLRITGRADGRVKIAYRASGETFDFTARIEDGTIRVDRRIPADQRDIDTGIVTIEYAGNDRVRPTEVHLRAADQRAELERGELSIEDGRLRAEGRIAGRARGLVRLRLGYEDERGEAAFWYGRARIEDGRWRVSAQLPATARGGGYLTIAFTGYLRARGGAMRGEQDAKQVLAGE